MLRRLRSLRRTWSQDDAPTIAHKTVTMPPQLVDDHSPADRQETLTKNAANSDGTGNVDRPVFAQHFTRPQAQTQRVPTRTQPHIESTTGTPDAGNRVFLRGRAIMNIGANSRTVLNLATIEVSVISAAVGAVVTLSVTKGIPNAWRVYQALRFDPKKAHRQYVLEQAPWFEERADKLEALSFQLGRDPRPDKFKQGELVSKLDQHDWQLAMDQTDIESLRKAVAEKALECRDNAAQSRRAADEIASKIYW